MWEVQPVPALVHTAFVISLASTAALVAVWAALSPRHRLLRLAGFCVLPGALVLASASWLAVWFLAAMVPITTVLFVGPFVASAPFGRTWLRLPKVRFGFRDLFFAIFLIAFALSGAILLSKQEYYLPRLRLWRPWVIEPLSLWVPVCGATGLVVGTSSRLKRIAMAVSACVLGSAAWYCAIWGFDDSFRWWELSGMWFDIRYAWWLGGLVPCVVALIVAVQLSTWRGACLERSRAGEGRSHGLRRRLWVAVRLAATAVLIAPSCVIYYELARPVPIPHCELPAPNGYDRLVAIGKEINVPALNPKRRDELVQQARDALKLPSLVSVDYSPLAMSTAQPLRALGRALDADAQGQQASGNHEAAIGIWLDLMELGDRTERGGVLLDSLLGSAIQRMGVVKLLGIGPGVSRAKCQELLPRIQRFEQQLDPLEQILDREYVFARHSYAWQGRWWEAVESLSRTGRSRRMAVELRKTTHAWLRVLICDLAVQAYQADHQRLPDCLDELVPEYLGAVPDGPFDGEPIKFLREPTQYSIWTSDDGKVMRGRPSPEVVRQIGT